jgi:hypothetical protein
MVGLYAAAGIGYGDQRPQFNAIPGDAHDTDPARVTVPATVTAGRVASWRPRYTLATAIMAFAIAGCMWEIITWLVFMAQIQGG